MEGQLRESPAVSRSQIVIEREFVGQFVNSWQSKVAPFDSVMKQIRESIYQSLHEGFRD